MKGFRSLTAAVIILIMRALAGAEVTSAPKFDLKSQVEEYQLRYGLKDPYSKLVSNRGDGYESLYGVRNFRVVLQGVLYRGGANNAYNRNGKRNNMNPLTSEGLTNLCEQGFSDAVYLYSKNFSKSVKSVSCRTVGNEDSQLRYSQITGLDTANERELLNLVYQHIKGFRRGPLYDHCWNGWHASGFVAAISLRQFCGWSAAEANAYWVKNTDGNSSGRTSIRNRIREFQPFTDLSIDESERALICP
jgi:hypothetical protein